ncbi:unknown [Bacteroides sp. CAG:754]|jgi:hypothetical protein|nr:unknown [Bacteroides sp. CAG:754]
MYKLVCIIGLLICFSSCHKIAYISLFNKTNDSLRIYCHYNINDRIDSVYIYPNDSCHLGFWGAFQSYEKLKNSNIYNMDSVQIFTSSKRVVYRDKESIYKLFVCNKDTAKIIETKTALH